MSDMPAWMWHALSGVLTREGRELIYDTKMEALGNRTPRQLWESDDPEDVVKLVLWIDTIYEPIFT